MGLFYQCRYVRYDLKYIAKPDLMPQLVQETRMVEDLIDAVNLFHFSDVQKNNTQMAEFGDQNTQYLLIYATLEMEMTSVIENKYLCYF